MNLPYGELPEAEFELFRDLIYQHAGIRVAPGKRVMVANRLRRRLRETGIDSFTAYRLFLTSPQGAPELPRFLDEITTHETYFYRDKAHFDWFGDKLLPSLIDLTARRLRPKRLRVWSAACSTGEELYTVALQIALQKPALAGWNITLLGTDLSGASLDAARAGRYEARALRLVPLDQQKRFFEHDPEAKSWTISPELRAMATWKQHNLLRKLDAEPFDCIFLKNVLIYFDDQSKRVVVRYLHAALAPGAYLVVGLTEGVHNMLEPLTKLSPWLYQRSAPETQNPARPGR